MTAAENPRAVIGNNQPPEPINYLAVGAPLPQSIGRCADLYSDVRALRLAMEKEVEVVKARETEVREHIIANLSKSQDTGAAGLKYRAQIVLKKMVKVSDWGIFHSWIRKNDRFDMLQKRIAEKAVQDWIDDPANWVQSIHPETQQPIMVPRMPPGCEGITIPDVSITKI